MFNKYYTKMKQSILFWIFSIILISQACKDKPAEPPYTITQSLISDSCMVVAEHPLASKVGLEILKAGGNAIDAAIASQFALAVVYPRAGNIGGGGFMVIRMADGETAALDYREKAPTASSRDMYLDSTGAVIEHLSKEGHLSVGVPGTVAGMEAAFTKYSKLKNWETLIEPAIKLAEEGFRITMPEAERFNSFKEAFLKHNSASIPFVKSDLWAMGDFLIQPELAKTLIRIKEQGSKGFYEGETTTLLLKK